MKTEIKIKSEKIAYWYFRLNGFLTIPNFVVHPDWGRGQRTDVDILGVRFPYRAELLENPMLDDEVFTKIKDKPYIIIAEVKSQTCNLNGPWTRREEKNMDRVLRAIGSFTNEVLEEVALKLYDEGIYKNELYYLSLFCVGNQINRDLQRKYPNVPQITWDNILSFIYNRFEKYKDPKSAHTQWDSTGQQLWNNFLRCKDENEFPSSMRKCNTWRNGPIGGTLGVYGETIHAHQS